MPEAVRKNGFVLVNALVIVAALSLVVLWMLSRAENVRVRNAAALEATQLQLYLDGFEAFARDIVIRDQMGGAAADHLNEEWAQPIPSVPLDRGRVSGQIRDLQGLFNLNTLANPENVAAKEAFLKLARRRGVSSRKAQLIADFVAPGGPSKTQAYLEAEVAMRPVGGSLLMREQLRQIPQLSEQEFNRLAPFITALPGETAINVNTASSEVIASHFPNVEATRFAGIVAQAKRQPFLSVESFNIALLKIISADELEALDSSVFSVGSTWFEVTIDAELDGRRASRRATIRRLSLSQGAHVSYRLDNWN